MHRTITAHALLLLLGVQPLVSAADTTARPAAVVATQADDAARAEREDAELRRWQEYQQSVAAALRSGSAPRDRALSTVVNFLGTFSGPDAAASLLLADAVRAAPNDTAVQWIAVREGMRGNEPTSYAMLALQNLREREPDNAALWLDELSRAQRRGDEHAVDTLLAKMATARRFDEYTAEVIEAAAEVFKRYPAPRADGDVGADLRGLSENTAAYATALATATTITSGSYQELATACRLASAGDEHAFRASDCAAVGRLMAAHGDSILSNRIGFALLRLSHTATPEDAAAAREQAWIYTQHGRRSADDAVDDDYVLSHLKDWIATSSEIDAARRALTRAGVEVQPPQDWVDDSSPLSPARLADHQAPSH